MPALSKDKMARVHEALPHVTLDVAGMAGAAGPDYDSACCAILAVSQFCGVVLLN